LLAVFSLLTVSTTSEFRRARARLAANTRHHPDRTDGDRQLIDAVSRERKLRAALGAPPEGITWLEYVPVAFAMPLTEGQRNDLELLLGPVGQRGQDRKPAGET
jgi:hypothetical protein